MNPYTGHGRHAVCPTFQKKFTAATLAPQMMAAPSATRTPDLPRPASYGLELLAPSAQTIAETITPRTAQIRPTVISAPTTLCNAAIPGSPLVWGRYRS